MKVVKPAKIPVLTRVVEIGRRSFFHVAGVIAFPLASPRALHDELTFWRTVGPALGEGAVLDEGCARVRGELLVCGSFFAPGGQPLPASFVRARVGAVDKRLAVVGDRVWRGSVPSDPEPITTMPIDWAHAFGGPKFERNPHGKGADPVEIDGRAAHPLPNVERYGALVRSPAERPEPAGFLPMDLTFAQRRRRAGTYDQGWFEEQFPGLPRDTDPAFFNAAPDDQWIDGFFHGDEEYGVENMSPDAPRLEGRLPGLTLRSFVTQRLPEGERFAEIPLRCDVVWLFPSVGLGAVIFHGALKIADDDAGDIVHLVCACEEPASPRPPQHYQEALARRLDKDKGAFAGLSDADLMPSRASGVAPNLGGLDIGQWIASENLAMANARRGQERDFADRRARFVAAGLDPDEHGAAALPPLPELPSPDDPDALAAFAEAELARSEEAKRDVEAEAEAIRAEVKQRHEAHGVDHEAAMAGAKVETGPPTFTAAAHLDRLAAVAAEARADGMPLLDLEEQLAEPRHRADFEGMEQRLHEMYRRFGHDQPTAPPMNADARERARIVLELALETDAGLARRDLTGASFSGMRLAGKNLAGAYLEAADLSGCDLAGARLDGAVLAKADLRGADLRGANLGGANLGGADLGGADLGGADLTDAVLSRADLRGAALSGAIFTGADWEATRLDGIDFSGAVLGRCNMLRADLRGARFVGADLSQANLIECSLDGADFSRATLHKTGFLACSGRGVSFREASFAQGVIVHGSSFPDADFSDADLKKVNLRGTALTGARFDRADLDGADLSACDASGASFERATMKGVMLIRTNLSRASLRGANLLDALASKALLAGADFTGANLYRADLSRVVGDAGTTFAEAEVGHVRFLPKAEPPAGGGA